jgi:hypothetical protein
MVPALRKARPDAGAGAKNSGTKTPQWSAGRRGVLRQGRHHARKGVDRVRCAIRRSAPLFMRIGRGLRSTTDAMRGEKRKNEGAARADQTTGPAELWLHHLREQCERNGLFEN